MLLSQTDAVGLINWDVSVDVTNTTRSDQGTGEAVPNYKNLPFHEAGPVDHGISRSRGGVATKIHLVVDGNGLWLTIIITCGQRNDEAMLEQVLNDIHVPRLNGDRPPTRADAVFADKAYA